MTFPPTSQLCRKSEEMEQIQRKMNKIYFSILPIINGNKLPKVKILYTNCHYSEHNKNSAKLIYNFPNSNLEISLFRRKHQISKNPNKIPFFIYGWNPFSKIILFIFISATYSCSLSCHFMLLCSYYCFITSRN